MSERIVFEKMFARDFCMIALEIAAISESRDDKPWAEGSKLPKPYLMIERADGTCNIWYNKKGVAWTNEVLASKVKTNADFLKEVEEKVRGGIKFIRSIYEKRGALGREDLLKFIDEFLKAYPWIEAMWWIKEMDSKELGVDNSNILKLREETDTLSAGTDIVIRNSLEKLYPDLGILSSMIRLEELRNRYIPCVLPILTYWSWDMKKKNGFDSGRIVSVWEKGSYSAIWEEKGFKGVADYSINYLIKNVKSLEKIREEGITSGEKVISHTKDFSEKVEEAKIDDFVKFLDGLHRKYNIFTEKNMLLWVFTGETVEKKIKETLNEYTGKEQQEIFSIMSLPKVKSYSQEEEEEFERIVDTAKEKGVKSVEKEIKIFSEKYF